MTYFSGNVENLFDLIANNIDAVWRALGSLLSTKMSSSLEESIEAIRLIDFSLKKLPIQSVAERYPRSILARLLAGVQKLCNHMKDTSQSLEFLPSSNASTTGFSSIKDHGEDNQILEP
jgi:hypothetical protein